MLKKVSLTNIHTGRVDQSIVDTDSDEKALVGAGKTQVENAKVVDITGLDEKLQRATGNGKVMGDRVALFNGLSKCFERNIPIIKSWELQANRVKTPRYRGVIADITQELNSGEKISDAMASHHDLFGADVVALVRAGEEAGRLPEIFRRIAGAQKKTSRILRKLKAGMIYPGIVMVLSLAVLILMSIFLVPNMAKLYTSLDSELPGATRMMMKISDLFIHKPWTIAIPIVLIVLFMKNWGKFTQIPAVQKAFLKIPIIEGIIRKSASAVSFRTLALLIGANVRLTTALDITSETSWHVDYKVFFQRVKNQILNGMTLPDAFLVESHLLGEDGRMICGLMEVAAETGSGTELLNEIAEDYEDELDAVANQIDRIIEPFTIVILGGMVGFLIYAIYSPVLSLGNAMFKK